MKLARFLLSSLAGLAFFALPIRIEGRFTVPFDLAVRGLIETAPGATGVYCLVLVLIGGIVSAGATASPRLRRRWPDFATSPPLAVLRLLGVPLALVFFFRLGPDLLLQPAVADLMWSTLAFSVAVIVPLGAAFLMLLVRYGLLELIGTLMEPVMRPLFRLPGRAALDSVTSWVGSYSVGLYLTRRLLAEGFYTRREAFTIATCFSTVSIGFVAVVVQTLGLLHLFPVVFGSYFAFVYLLTALLCRLWPNRSIPNDYVSEGLPEGVPPRSTGRLWRRAWRRALDQAASAAGPLTTLREGVADGLRLASTILGSILTVGTGALLLGHETPLFTWLGRPLVPVLEGLGLPDSDTLAPAAVVGLAEMYLPALFAREASEPARFFVAVLSVSQLIFFSSVAPMMLDMFRDIPIRVRHLLALFAMRTAVLIPAIAALTRLLAAWGVVG